jgi:hypothetical protein
MKLGTVAPACKGRQRIATVIKFNHILLVNLPVSNGNYEFMTGAHVDRQFAIQFRDRNKKFLPAASTCEDVRLAFSSMSVVS